MASESKEGPLHADSELSHRAGCALSLFGAPEAKCVVARDIDGNSAKVIGNTEVLSIQFHSHPESVVIAGRTKLPRPIHGIVYEIKNSSCLRDVPSENVNEEVLGRRRIDE